jgi:hypothetical protein
MRIISIALLLISIQITAQKRDENWVYFRFNTTPFVELPKELKTYNVTLETPFDLYTKVELMAMNGIAAILDDEAKKQNLDAKSRLVKDSVKLDEYRFRAATQNTDFNISISTSQITIDSVFSGDLSSLLLIFLNNIL